MTAAVSIDLDNILTLYPGVRAQMDWKKLGEAFKAEGVVEGTCFGNRLSPDERAGIQSIGLNPVSFGANVDDMVKAAANYFVRHHDKVLVLSGDHFALDVAKTAANQDVEVHIWARRHAVSLELIRSVTAYRAIDVFLESKVAA